MWLYDDARECASERVLSAFEVKFMAFGPDMIDLSFSGQMRVCRMYESCGECGLTRLRALNIWCNGRAWWDLIDNAVNLPGFSRTCW